MPRRKKEYDYLLHLYSRVDKYLSIDKPKYEELEEVVVSFCIVVERVLKMKLQSKNPFLVYDVSRLKDDNMISALAKKIVVDAETIKIQSTLNRFEIIFDKTFSAQEILSIKDIYGVRNSLVHSYLSEENVIKDKEGLIKQMIYIWPKISKLAKSVLGKERILSSKPKKSYTESEFNKAIFSELMKKIKQPARVRVGIYQNGTIATDVYTSGYSYIGSKNKCPRCESFNFEVSKEPLGSNYGISGSISVYDPTLISSVAGIGIGGSSSNIYKCSKCNLELTQNEYELYLKEVSKQKS